MSLHIQMIGTGSAFAKNYYNNNALIHMTDGYKLLVDCGFTFSRALMEMGLPLDQIDAVLITHIHADHIGGLEELAFQNKYLFQRRIPLYVPKPLEMILWEHSLRGGLENRAEGVKDLDDYFEVIAIPPETETKLHPELTLRLIPTEHIPGKDSYSLLFNNKLYYSSDSKLNRELLIKLIADGCEQIWHDCQLYSPGVVHASLDDLLTLPEHVQKKTLLMHYSDQMPNFIGKTGHMHFIEQFKSYKI